jgi:hypothetical protein
MSIFLFDSVWWKAIPLYYKNKVLVAMQKYNMFSRVSGKIKKIFMAAPQEGDIAHFERIAGVFKQLHCDASLLVWCNSGEIQAQLKDFLKKEGITSESRLLGAILPAASSCVLLSPDGLESYSRWVRDAFVFGAVGSNRAVFVIKTAVPKDTDIHWAERHLQFLRFDDGTNILPHPSIIPVAGGNLMADGNFFMFGAQQYRWHKLASSDWCLSSLTGNRSNARLIEIGGHTTTPPRKLAHLDLYISLTGCVARSSGRPVVIIATCSLLSISPLADLLPVVERTNSFLDTVADTLVEEGFHILRNPAPMLKNERTGAFYLCSLNNCLVEVTSKSRTVWLPNITQGQEQSTYYDRLQQVEKDNALLWEQLGFEVRFIAGDFHGIMDEEGSLHCITNEIIREKPSAKPQFADI